MRVLLLGPSHLFELAVVAATRHSRRRLHTLVVRARPQEQRANWLRATEAIVIQVFELATSHGWDLTFAIGLLAANLARAIRPWPHRDHRPRGHYTEPTHRVEHVSDGEVRQDRRRPHGPGGRRDAQTSFSSEPTRSSGWTRPTSAVRGCTRRCVSRPELTSPGSQPAAVQR